MNDRINKFWEKKFKTINLVGDVKANSRDFYRYIASKKRRRSRYPPLKKRNGSGLAESYFEKAGEFNVVFTKTEHGQVPLLNRKTPFVEDIVVSRKMIWRKCKSVQLGL